MDRIGQVAVVVPVHNEEQHLARALAGIRAAANALQACQPGVGVTVVVVLDTCTDNSGDIAARAAAADTRITLSRGCLPERGEKPPGGHRNAAGRLSTVRGVLPPGGCGWPTRMPIPAFLRTGCRARSASRTPGRTPCSDQWNRIRTGMDPEILRRWHARHPFEEDHAHVYGANFGVRASAYELSGGFPRQRSHEDRALVETLRRRGFTVRATDSIRVLTSGRIHARAPHGFGAYLLALGLEPAVAVEG